MDQYQKGPVIGEGTYGTVLCAVHKATGQHVALKKVKLRNSKEGINVSVLRELKALKALRSPHIVHLLDVFTTKSSLVLVFEYMEWSLEDVIKDKQCLLAAADVKAYMQMLLQALAFVHSNDVAHRDIKPDNMLIGSDGVMKLADFGLARSLDSSAAGSQTRLTPQVFGRWYRPPELLMGCSSYGCSVDMWAAGCVLAEMLLRRPWFPASCDMEQLDRIFKALGVPTLESWPGMAELPNKILFKPAPGQPLEEVFPKASQDCLDLLRQLMRYEPEKRITAAAALQHPYFSSTPTATAPGDLPKPSSFRGNRRDVTSIPALLQEMLARSDVLVRQQQPAPDVCSNRSLFPSSSTTLTGRCLQGPAVQQPAVLPNNLLAGLTGTSNAASRPGRGASASGFEAFCGALEQQQQGVGQLRRSLSGFSGLSDEAAASHPLKCRLSFGSTHDEHSGMQDQPSRPGSVEVGQEAPPAAGGEGQQQQGLRRPSPSIQQQGPGKGSMRPPLHRTSSAQAAATPVSAWPNNAVPVGDTVMQPVSAIPVGAAKRKVSDLAAALNSAAAGYGVAAAAPGHSVASAVAFPVLTGSAQQRPSDQALPGCGIGGFSSFMHTPAAGQSSSCTDVPCPAADDTDMLGATGLGTSAHKRPRVVFEAADEAPAHGDIGRHHRTDAVASIMQQQEQQQGVGPMSIGRRILRGRRSSMGCCNMDMDDLEHQPQQEQQLQHSVVGLMPPPNAHAQNHNHSTTKHTRHCSPVSDHLDRIQQAGVDATSHMVEGTKQQQLECFLEVGCSGRIRHQTADRSSSVSLQVLQPWHQLSTAGVGHNSSNPAAEAALPECPMSLDQQYRAAVGGHKRQFTAPSTGGETKATDLPAGADSVGPCTSQRLGCLIGGLQEGLPVYTDEDGVTPALRFTEEELAMMDPHQLAEWANQLKPIVQSAEKRYLKERKLQMDEALLHASQPDNDQGPDSTLSPDNYPKQPSILGSPLTDRQFRGLNNKYRAILHHNNTSGLASASVTHNCLATVADGNVAAGIGRVDSTEGHEVQPPKCTAAGTAVTPA